MLNCRIQHLRFLIGSYECEGKRIKDSMLQSKKICPSLIFVSLWSAKHRVTVVSEVTGNVSISSGMTCRLSFFWSHPVPVGPQRTVSVQPTTGSVSVTCFFFFLSLVGNSTQNCVCADLKLSTGKVQFLVIFFFSFGNVDSNKSKHFVSCLRVFGGN